MVFKCFLTAARFGWCSFFFGTDLGRKPPHNPQQNHNAWFTSYRREAHASPPPAKACQAQRQDRRGQERRGKSRPGGPSTEHEKPDQPRRASEARETGREGKDRPQQAMSFRTEKLERPKISQKKSGLSQRRKKGGRREGARKKHTQLQTS